MSYVGKDGTSAALGLGSLSGLGRDLRAILGNLTGGLREKAVCYGENAEGARAGGSGASRISDIKRRFLSTPATDCRFATLRNRVILQQIFTLKN